MIFTDLSENGELARITHYFGVALGALTSALTLSVRSKMDEREQREIREAIAICELELQRFIQRRKELINEKSD